MTKKIILISILLSFIFLVAANIVLAQRKYLFQWDEGNGHNMPGWTWYNKGNDTIYAGHPGWVNNTAWPAAPNTQQGPGPRTFASDGYNTSITGEIITNDHSPSTTEGGALHISDDGTVSNYQAMWYQWYDGVGLGMSPRDVTNDTTDRWSFYIKVHAGEYMSGGSSGGLGTYFHVGTYLCDDGGADGGCPYEGPGNTHYYFYLYYQPDIWIHTLLDRHPTHKRDSFVEGDDPNWIYPNVVNGTAYPMHFYTHMHQFYMEIRNPQNNPTFYDLDEMYFYSTQDATEEIEPNQNDESVTSLWVGYEPATGHWYTGWQDESFEDHAGEHLNDQTNSTFVMRWSTNPITNDNFDQANIVTPDWFTYPDATSVVNGIRRQDPWSTRTWTRFRLPPGTEDNYNHIYFAIKDVSVAGAQNAGTSWPWNRDDGHDAPTSNIKTIDYYIRPNDQITNSRSDVNQDNQVNTTDALLTLRKSLGLGMSNTNWQDSPTTGDVNCDNTTNSTDAMLILRKSLGLNMETTDWCVN